MHLRRIELNGPPRKGLFVLFGRGWWRVCLPASRIDHDGEEAEQILNALIVDEIERERRFFLTEDEICAWSHEQAFGVLETDVRKRVRSQQ